MRIASLAPAPLALLLALSALGCLQIDTGDGDAGTSSSSTTTSSDSGTATTTSTTPTGTGCTGDLGGGIELCTSISTCSSVSVDHDSFPDCGFRIHGDAIDLECVCDGQLCPIGAPATCSDAQTLLSNQSEVGVCEQIDDSRCTSLSGSDAGSTSSSCDVECESQCAGAPSCIQLCGC